MFEYDDPENSQDAGTQQPADHTTRLQSDSRKDGKQVPGNGADSSVATDLKKKESADSKIELTNKDHKYSFPAYNLLRKKINEIISEDPVKSSVLKRRLIDDSVEKKLVSDLDKVGREKIPGYARLADKETKTEKEKLREWKLDLFLDLIAKKNLPEYAQCNDQEKAQVRESLHGGSLDLLLGLTAEQSDPAYAGLDDSQKIKVRQKIYADMQESANDEYEQLKVKVINEINGDEFGVASRSAYVAYVNEINEESTMASSKLVEKKMRLPPGCPLKVPVDEHGIAYDSEQVRQSIASGELKSELPNYANGKEDPGLKDINELTLTENFLQEAQEKLSAKNPANIRELAKQYQSMFKSLFEGNPRPGWVPDISKLSDSEVFEYCENAAPWLEVLPQLNEIGRSVEVLAQAPGDLDTAAFAESLKEGFPGKPIEVVDGEIIITPTLPDTLDSSQFGINQRKLLSDWIEPARAAVARVVSEYDFAGQIQNKDKVCYWGDKPADKLPGTDVAMHEGQEYEYKHCRSTAQPVDVQIIQPNGKKDTERRIKVTTTTEYMRSGLFGDYPVGKPVVSGYATVNGERLEESDQLLGLGPSGQVVHGMNGVPGQRQTDGICAQMRISEKGTVQVKALSAASGTTAVTDASGKTTVLKPASNANDGWVDVLPGYKLAVGKSAANLKEIKLQDNGVRYYRLNEPLAFGGPDRMDLMRADALPGWIAFYEAAENVLDVASKAVDVGFALGGGIEGIAFASAKKQLGKEFFKRTAVGLTRTVAERESAALARTVVEREAVVAARGLGDVALRRSLEALKTSRNKKLALGMLGIFNHQTKYVGNKVGAVIGAPHAGDWTDTGRSLFMGTDIAASATMKVPVLGKLSRGWASLWGHADEALMAKYLGKSETLKGIYEWNEKILRGVDPIYSGDAVLGVINLGKESRRKIAEIEAQERKVFQEITARLGGHGGQLSVANQFASLLSKKDQENITTTLIKVDEEIGKGEAAKEKEINRLASVLLDNQATQQDKLASAMALLLHRQRSDGSTPDVLAAYTSDAGGQQAVRLADVEKVIMDYRPVSFRKSESGSLPDIVAATRNSLGLPPESLGRPEHVSQLIGIFNDKKQSESNRLAAGLGLLLLGADKHGAIPQGLGERKGWAVSVNVAVPNSEREAKVATRSVFEEDKKTAIEIAGDSLPQPVNQSYWYTAEPIRETVALSEVLTHMRGQLASIKNKTEPRTDTDLVQPIQYTYSPAARLAMADALYQLGQMGPEEHGVVCLEALTDAKADKAQKLAAFFDGKKERFPQLLGYYQDQGKAARAQAALDRVLKSPNQDPDVKAIASIMLDVSRIEDPEQRQAQLNNLHASWQSYQNQSGAARSKKSFGRVYADYLVNSFADKDKSRQENFHTAFRLHQLSINGVVKLNDDERRQIAGGFTQTLQFVSDQKDHPFFRKSGLNIDKTEKEMAVGAMRILTDQIDLVGDKQKPVLSDGQKQALRTNLINILNLPNPGHVTPGKDEDAGQAPEDPLGETVFKLAVIKNAQALFSKADEDEVKQLVEALQKNVRELTAPHANTGSNAEDDEDEVDAEAGVLEKMAQQITSKRKHQLVEQSIKVLSQLVLARADLDSEKTTAMKTDTVDLLIELAANKCQSAPGSMDAHIRLAALDALSELHSLDDGVEEKVKTICSTLLMTEHDPMILEGVEAVQRLSSQKDPNSFYAEYLQSKREIMDPGKKLDLKAAETYIARYFSEGLSDYEPINSAEERLSNTLSELEKTKLLRTRISQVVDRILQTSPEHTELDRQVLFLLACGKAPIIHEYRQQATELAAKGWRRIVEEGSPEVKKAMAPLTGLLMADTTSMPYNSRHDILSSWLILAPLMTKQQMAAPISMDLENEFHRCPRDITHPDFKASQDFQLAEFKALGPFLTNEQIPLLVAIADDEFKSNLHRDENGLVNEVPYPNGGKLVVKKENGRITSFAFLQKDGTGDQWVKDKTSGFFFAKSDEKKEHPWRCTPDLFNNGTLVIKDAPDPNAPVPRDSGGQRLVQIEKFASGQAGGRSPGGTLTGQYGSETAYTRAGAKIVQVPLGDPAAPLTLGTKSSYGTVEVYQQRRQSDQSFLWVEVTYPDGSVRSQECDTMGRGVGLLAFTPGPAAARGPGGAMPMPGHQLNLIGLSAKAPAWLSGIDRLGGSEGFDRDTYSFRRFDVPKKQADGASTIYETRVDPSGRVVTEKQEWASRQSEKPETTAILCTAGLDDDSDHPMPLVRKAARSLLARQAEDTEAIREEVQAALASKSMSLEHSVKELKAVLNNPRSTSEDVCKAIFTTGLSVPIKDENDPRRDQLNTLLSSQHERIRLSAAQVLAEQSTVLSDRQAAALELAHLAEEGSLLGYRQGAQRSMQMLRQKLEDHSGPSNSVIRLALGLNISNDSNPEAIRQLLNDSRASIRLKAARVLLKTDLDTDKQAAARVTCQLATGANTIAMRDKAMEVIRHKDNNDRVQEALGRSHYDQQLLATTLALTQQQALPAQANQPRLVSDESSDAFRQRYHEVKLAIGASKVNYLAEFHQELLSDDKRYKYLDTKRFDELTKERAMKNQSWAGWALRLTPDYAAAAKKSLEYRHLQMVTLGGDAMADVDPTKGDNNSSPAEKIQRAHRARVILDHLLSTDRGELGKEALKAIVDICGGTGTDAYQMTEIVFNRFLCDPTLSSSKRKDLFGALEKHGDNSGNPIFKARLAQATARILELEYQIMPRDTESQQFHDSENFQVKLLGYWQKSHYKGNLATALALNTESPSPLVKTAADQLLRSLKADNKGKPVIAIPREPSAKPIASKKNLTTIQAKGKRSGTIIDIEKNRYLPDVTIG